ncbi:unnamed protein product [Pieris macdunnoughi]|uniref:Uncharacterized protein n=1 Tax=Pieris macdunnoughi TaxID=345717 RepID=A0A821REG5_9NEOP|nr:unnamed protein product [Pieris macdunnoughi]
MNHDESLEFVSVSSSDFESFHSTEISPPPLHNILTALFKDQSRHLNVIHINAQSVPAHHLDLLTTFVSNEIHAILISETWLCPTLSSLSYSIPGFNLIRNDRVGMRGGGVAIYLRSHIHYTIINMSPQPPPPNACEHLLIEVMLSKTKILLGVFYSPSLLVDYFAGFDNTLERFVPLYKNIVIMGDFNTCLLKDDCRSKKLLSITDSYNLHNLPLRATHKVPGSTPSLLDLIFTSSPDLVTNHGQLPAVAFSHHDLLYLSLNLKPPKLKPTVVLRRNFAAIDTKRLLIDAAKIDFSSIYECPTINGKVDLLNASITNLFDIHAPLRPVKLKHLPAPWLNDEIKTLINQKNRAKAKLRTAKTDKERVLYKTLRNRCNTRCRDAQRRHIHDSVSNGDPSKIWKFLKSLGVGKPPCPSMPPDIEVNSLNAHFTSHSTSSNIDLALTLEYISSLPRPSFPSFSFTEFSSQKVESSISSIHSNAVGSDLIGRAMIIPIVSLVLPVITHIFNFSISSGEFPSCWKDGLIIPIPKKANPSTFSDFRPISILPFLSKKRLIELLGEQRPPLDQLFDHMCRLLGLYLQQEGILPKNIDANELIGRAYRLCPHHVSHYLGLDVHDSPLVRRRIPVTNNMIVTVEPGIYISPDDTSVPPEFRGVGIRIEDDVLITDGHPLILTDTCVKEVNDIEAIVGKQNI